MALTFVTGQRIAIHCASSQ